MQDRLLGYYNQNGGVNLSFTDAVKQAVNSVNNIQAYMNYTGKDKKKKNVERF